MRKIILVIFMGTFLVLGGLAACSQIAPSATQSPAPTSTSTLAPDRAYTQVSGATLPPPTATSTATAVPTRLNSPTPVPATVVPTIVNTTPLPPSVSGVIAGPNGPLAQAVVQIKGTHNQTTTAADGTFILKGISGTTPITVVAWSAGFYQGWADLNPSAPAWMGGQGIAITLKPLYAADNVNYTWFSWQGVKGSASCGLCHREYPEWQADAHSQSAKNQRFASVYTGSDVKGNPGQPVLFDNKGLPLPPDPNKPYYGVGFRLDTPNRAGNCATCHTPVASKVTTNTNCGWSGCHTDLTTEHSKGVIAASTNPVNLSGEGADGITCEFCHKVGEVTLDSKTGLPFPDMPGILSMRLFRPPDGEQIFFGTMIDVTRRVSYSPLESKSEYCAPCHYGVFGGVMGSGTVTHGTLIYNSFGEWLKSPYSDPKTGKTCQDCHMPVIDSKVSVFAKDGGLQRDYVSLHGHTMPGASDETLLKNAVQLKTNVLHTNAKLGVDISITNHNTGHDIPTDAPIRSMILVVEALDAAGNPLALSQGPLNPAYSGNYGGKPGKTFAKVLKDEWTGETPTTAYWRPVTIVEDTRLAALATDTTHYTFDLPAGKVATVNVKLVFRRAFQALAQQKGWNDPDIVMKSETIQVER